MKQLKGIIIFILLFSFQTYAKKNEPLYPEYYTFTERQLETNLDSDANFNPTFFLQAAKQLVVNLLRWTLHREYRPLPDEAYMRKIHFGRWINDPTDDTCMNTRAKVLVRESSEEITYRNDRQCVVASGKWLDPYSNQEFLSAREIQIDHMVPLKNAYMAGAWKWDFRTRCLYANYLGYRNHLVPASVHENTTKGDRAPDSYLPSDFSYRCQYVKDWLTIKLIWNLNMTEAEVQAVYDIVTNYNCSTSDFQIHQEELKQQRRIITENLDFCMTNAR